MYHSPLRPDKNASFSVSTQKNLWMDFGTSQGGNVIDLAIALKGYCPFSEAVTWLEEQAKWFHKDILYEDFSRYDDTHMSRLSGHSNISNMRVENLTSPRLLEYLNSRGIPAGIGQLYCKEAHYTVRDREYYGVAFMNILGGMEIRSRFFKGCHGVKARPSSVLRRAGGRAAAAFSRGSWISCHIRYWKRKATRRLSSRSRATVSS